jgi:gamma-glutamylputrescine oxidase
LRSELAVTATPDNSYYSATAHPRDPLPALQGEIAADVCVVGAGISGCSVALELASRGFKVVVLERARVGDGASGRNGGQALVGYACGQEKLEAEVGFETARQMWDLSVEALALLRQRVERYRIDCDLQWGHVQVAIKERQRRELLEEQERLQQRYGYRELQFIDRHDLRELLATDRYIAGLLDRGSAHLHPLNYTLGLARAAREAGAAIHEHSTVTGIEYGDPARVSTRDGAVRARFVVLCGNAYLNGLVPALHSRIMPVGTYIIATQSLGEERATQLIRRNFAVADINFVLDYFRRSADHRLLFGGRASYSGRDIFDTARATRRRMVRVFPQLADVKVEFAWGGYVDITLSRAPDFGRLRPNIYYLQGFSGHGLALSGMAGKLAAEAIAQQSSRFDVYSKLRHRDFPGGRWLRMPSLVLAMMWYRLRDLL